VEENTSEKDLFWSQTFCLVSVQVLVKFGLIWY